MAVYRQVQISYWQDSFVLKLTPEEKFFYLYLLTNSKTKQCGIYELPLKIIEIETGYNRETVIKLIQRFIEHKKIKYDWENEEIFLLNWLKHNPFEKNPKILKCIQNELKSVHNPSMIPEDSPLIPLTRGMQGVSQKEKEEEQEEKQEQEERYPSLKRVIEYFESNGYPKEQAESFWSYYDGLGWETAKGGIIRNWQSKVIGWMNNQKQFDIPSKKNGNGFYTYREMMDIVNDNRNSTKQTDFEFVSKDKWKRK